jgi:RES domain
MAMHVGLDDHSRCSRCGSITGRKVNRENLQLIAYTFFVGGTIRRFEYGAAPLVQFNDRRETEIASSPWLSTDIRLFEEELGIGFFHYGPRLWMFGEIEPLDALRDAETRPEIIRRILAEYPSFELRPDLAIYRLRIAPREPANPAEYDSPPSGGGTGRLDSPALSVMYASPDLQVCVHECRATADDEIFVATLHATTGLKLLDLTEVLKEDDTTEFESLDLAVHMLFLAAKHSYEITREIAAAAHAASYDGLVYPSYFSLLRTGALPFATSYGLAHRRIPEFAEHEKAKIVPNLALFGRPVADGKVEVTYQSRHDPAGGVHVNLRTGKDRMN